MVGGATDVGIFKVIVAAEVFAGYWPDLARFSVKVHEPDEPIVNVLGLLLSDKVHEPVLDQVLAPGELVVATDHSSFT